MDGLTLDQKHAEWLHLERKIPLEVLAMNGVVTCRGNVAFEYVKNGILQYRKMRIVDENGEKTFQRDRSGAETCLWGIDTLRDASNGTVIITEGEIDRLSVLAVGMGPVVSVPDGAQRKEVGTEKIVPQSDKPFSWLWDGDDYVEGLRDVEKIILAVDDDDKGDVLFEELSVRLGRDRCWRVKYPDGCKDANEVLDKLGEDALREVIEGARPLVPDRLVRLSELDLGPARASFSSGWKELDRHLMVCAPELMIVTGPPNAGKSQAVLAICANQARDHGNRVAYLQFEDNPERNIDDLRKYALANIDGITNRTQAFKWIDDYFFFVSPSESEGDEDMGLDWLKAVIKEASQRHGCKIVVIDPWNEVEHCWARHESQALYLNRALRQLKRLARRYRICLIIVAHPDKQAGRSGQSITQWSLYDLDGGAVWNNKADHGLIILHNKDVKGETYWNISKSKDWLRLGEPGIVRMRFKPACGTYEYKGSGV
jgi:twinkle protein